MDRLAPKRKPTSEGELIRLRDALQRELDTQWLHREAGILAPGMRWFVRGETPRERERSVASLQAQLHRLADATPAYPESAARPLAEATLAFTERRYATAVAILRDLEADAEAYTTDAASLARMHSLRGDALFAMGAWKSARGCYERSGGGLLLGTKICVCLAHEAEDQQRRELANRLASLSRRINDSPSATMRNAPSDSSMVTALSAHVPISEPAELKRSSLPDTATSATTFDIGSPSTSRSPRNVAMSLLSWR